MAIFDALFLAQKVFASVHLHHQVESVLPLLASTNMST